MSIRQISIIALLLTVFSSAAVAFPSRPQPQRLVNDLAGIFTPGQVADLEHRLVVLDDSTSNQITVVTVSDLEGYEPAEYATKIGLEWGVGSKDFNNGVVLLVKPKTSDSGGCVSIQVGYGLEGAIPDAYCKRIIENDMIPHFRQGDYFGGVSDAVDILSALASGEISVARDKDEGSEDSPAYILLSVIIFLFIVWILAKHSGGRNGGGSGSSGNGRSRSSSSPDIFFGPMSGGSFGGPSGGMSGGNFGGFGGGSFGGGGASGKW